MGTPRVGLVLVSHSAELARGLAALAGQMAGDVPIEAAGGREDGGIGTSFDLVESAVGRLTDRGLGVVILTDLGSATMTVETLLDFLDDESVVFAEAPLVEGGVAAAVAAQQGNDVAAVAEAAKRAGATFAAAASGAASGDTGEAGAAAGANGADADAATTPTSAAAGEYTRAAEVADDTGLHARPAAKIAEMAADAEGITINGEEADSALTIMGLGLSHGDTATVAGPAAAKATVDRIADAIAAGLDAQP